MASRTIVMTEALEKYVLRVGVKDSEVLADLRDETARLPNAGMQIGPDQAQFMRWLVELIGAKRCLEVGVFTGYSSLAVALSLPDEGRLIACDIDPNVTAIAQRYWQRAGVADKIRLELRPAAETLRSLVETGQGETFDFAFVDADKESLDSYYETCLILLRQGGLLLIDNTLWHGRVVEPQHDDPATRSVVALNLKIRQDPRVCACMLAVGDGLTLLRKI